MNFKILLLSILLLLISCKKQETEKDESVQKNADSLITPFELTNNYKAYFTDDTSLPDNGEVKVTFFGVSTLLFDDGETQLLIDGFFSRPSKNEVMTAKISTDKIAADSIISRFKMDRVKAIFVAHSHYDHAFDVAYVTQKTNAELFGSLSTLNIGRGGGLKEDRMSLFIPGKLHNFGKFGVIVLESKHSPKDPKTNDEGKEILFPLSQPATSLEYFEGGSYDFIIRYNNKTIYLKPSANYIKGMLNTFEADVLFLGIAQTGSADREFKTEFYEHTVSRLRPELIVPLHWDNFFLFLSEELHPLSGSFYERAEDFDWIIEKTKSDKIDFKILQWGRSIMLFTEEELSIK